MSVAESFWNDFMIEFARFTTYSMIIPVVVSLLYKKKWNYALKTIFWYCLLTVTLNLGETVLIWASGKYSDYVVPILNFFNLSNTIFLQLFFYLKNFICIGVFYSIVFPDLVFKRNVYKLSILLSAIVTVNYFFGEGFRELGIVSPFLNVAFCVTFPLLYLWFSQKNSLRIPLRKNPYLWISLGLFLPNLLGLFLYLSSDLIYKYDFILFCQLQSLKNFFEILGQVLLALGFTYSYHAKFISQ